MCWSPWVPPLQLQAAAPPQSSGPPHHPQTSYAGLHFSAAVLLAAVWWFYQQDIPGLQRKLLTVFLFPVSWRACMSFRHLAASHTIRTPAV